MKIKILLLNIMVAIMFSNCSIYTPTSINTPLFTEKGQVAMNVTAGSGFNF